MSFVRNDVLDALVVGELQRGRVTTPLRANQRQALYGLMVAYGISDTNTFALVGERDLVALFEAALASVERGKAVADNIMRKYGVNPLLDPVTLKPEQRPAVASPPVAPTPSADMSRYVTRTDLSDTLLAVTDALPDVVRGHVTEALKSLTPVTLHVVLPGKAPTVLGTVHRKVPSIIRKLGAGVNVYLHGPAGSGKTTAGRQCADAFGLPFYFAAKVESEYMLLGFKDARGETVRTQFREAYEHGGVFLFDELDGSSPGAVVAMNAALANGICPFPDGVIVRHENFKCIAAGNTKLSGATREYVGRNQLDAASVDRFAFVEFDYDDALENALATNADWRKYVQSARKAVKERALKHLITPRATYGGCKLLEAGDTWEECEDAVLWKGLDRDTVLQLKRAMDVKPPKTQGVL